MLSQNHISADGCQAVGPCGKKALIVDDESIVRWSLTKCLEDEGYSVASAGSGMKAMQRIEEENPEVVLLDIKLPDQNGLSILKTIKELRPEISVIMMTGHADVKGSVEAMKLGAFDYLEKPLDFNDIKRILDLVKAKSMLHRKIAEDPSFVYKSPKMKEVMRIAECLAVRSDVTILVLGESGTGKNFLSKKIHELSPRKEMPFIEMSCANIPEHLFESEVFGYEKGAFTDARASKKGLFELASSGTVFLDEIGDMPYPMQAKLLTLIEEKRFRRIGGHEQVQVDVRICAATNKNLSDLVEEKKFRLDLFYRLNVATIEIPPLRDRTEDISPLVHHFLRHYGKKYLNTTGRISDEALSILIAYDWPGNIRELKNLIEKTLLLAKDGMIDTACLPAYVVHTGKVGGSVKEKMPEFQPGRGVADNLDLGGLEGMSLKAMEEAFIKAALKLSDGNQRKAARLLDVSRDTLRYRLKKLGI